MELCAFVGREKSILGNCHLHSLLCALHIILYFVALDGIVCPVCIDCVSKKGIQVTKSNWIILYDSQWFGKLSRFKNNLVETSVLDS